MMKSETLSFSFFGRRGQVALTTVFLIGSFIILMALTLAFLSISIVTSGRSVQSSNQALSIASAGVEEAVLRVVRDTGFSGSFTVEVNGKTASVSVTNTSSTNGLVTIISSSTVHFSQRAIQAVLSITSSTGQVNVVSSQQI